MYKIPLINKDNGDIIIKKFNKVNKIRENSVDKLDFGGFENVFVGKFLAINAVKTVY